MLGFLWLFVIPFDKQTTKTPDHNLNNASWKMKMSFQASWNVTVFKHWISLEKQTNVWQLTENVHISQIQTDLRYLIGNVPMRRLPHVGTLTTFAQHVWYAFWSCAGVVMLTHRVLNTWIYHRAKQFHIFIDTRSISATTTWRLRLPYDSRHE